jgi:hypothetical protein
MARMNNRITPEESTGETIATFGTGTLVKTRSGSFEFRGGTENDHADAKEWASMFMPEIVVRIDARLESHESHMRDKIVLALKSNTFTLATNSPSEDQRATTERRHPRRGLPALRTHTSSMETDAIQTASNVDQIALNVKTERHLNRESLAWENRVRTRTRCKPVVAEKNQTLMKKLLLPFAHSLLLILMSVSCWQAAAQQAQDSQALQLVDTPPLFGTFFSASSGIPYPFDPSFGQLPVYQWKPGVYVVDDTQVDTGVSASLRSTSFDGGGAMMMLSLPSPCTECPTNSDGGGPVNFGPVDYSSSNVLWLEIALGTNASTALITLHNTTNGVRYQLLSRPEVDLPLWLVEQTLFGAAGTNTTTTVLFNDRPLLFFQAGIDTDGDGVTDYWEAILGTNPNLPDTDNDGVDDYTEFIQGRNPNDPNGAVSDTTGLINLQVYTPLR